MGNNVRGRPQRAAREPSGGDNAKQLRRRIAWMLRINRLYGPEPAWISGAAFSTAFAGGCYPGAASASKISRWETGLIDVPYLAIRRYEQLLGLPACGLTSTANIITRYLSPSVGDRAPGRSWPTSAHPVTAHSLEGFLELATSSAEITAAEWDGAVGLISRSPGLWLRRMEWDKICQRLLVETVAADGEAWKPRFEAFNLLLQHPGAQQSAVAACADWANCQDNRVFTETVSVLDGCPHPDAAAAIVSQLTAPTNDDAFAGALLACIRKVAEHHFTPSQLIVVANVAADVLSSASPALQELRWHAAAVSARLPTAPHPQALRPARMLAEPCSNGRARTGTHPCSTADSSISALIAARSISQVPREIGHFNDYILPVLINEVLHAPIADTRLYSAFLIRATPYAQPVAKALAWTLTRLRHNQDPHLTARILEGLRILGGSGQRETVERLTRPSLPLVIQDAAFRALGHMSGTTDASFWKQALERHSLQADERKSSERLLDHAVYAISMHRDLAQLQRIAADPALATSARAAARWWLSLPGYMLASAEH